MLVSPRLMSIPCARYLDTHFCLRGARSSQIHHRSGHGSGWSPLLSAAYLVLQSRGPRFKSSWAGQKYFGLMLA